MTYYCGENLDTMKQLFLIPFFCLSMAAFLSAQDHFLVQLENRSPDVNAMVMAYEGSAAIPFLAKDVKGVEYSLMNMKGKTVLLWFWNQDCPLCLTHIDALNLLAQKYPNDLQIVSFSDNTKEEVLSFMQNTPLGFPVIPNSKTLADGPYGGDLGYPKYFMVDKTGKIKWAIPEVEMRGDFNAFNFLETLHVSLSK